jgi:hypothetical protein
LKQSTNGIKHEAQQMKNLEKVFGPIKTCSINTFTIQEDTTARYKNRTKVKLAVGSVF